LCVCITFLLQSYSYNKKYELHNNHEPTATYWIFNILFRDVNRSINRLELSLVPVNGIIHKANKDHKPDMLGNVAILKILGCGEWEVIIGVIFLRD
jgi:hypothetical protein